MSVLVIHTILRLFVNTLTVNEKRYVLNRDNLTEPNPMQLSQKQRTFLKFFLHFENLYYILNIFHKKMTLIADVFPEILAPRCMVR